MPGIFHWQTRRFIGAPQMGSKKLGESYHWQTRRVIGAQFPTKNLNISTQNLKNYQYTNAKNGQSQVQKNRTFRYPVKTEYTWESL